MEKKRARARERPGIQSVEIGSRILAAMADARQPLQLKDVARGSNMSAAKVHRYLVSLTRTNLVTQAGDGRYSIGPAAIALGLAGLYSLDVVRIASDSLIELRDSSGETAVLASWSDAGPVIIRIEESSRPIFMNVRVGSTLPIMRTAVGRIFAAYLPKQDTAALIESERRSLNRMGKRDSRLSTADIITTTQRHGIAVVEGDLVPGVTALAAPVFDHRARIVASIGLLGGPEDFTATATSKAATLLKKTAESISRRLGFVPPRPPA
jgi:DNA-binding IclR family transcriptional regulator